MSVPKDATKYAPTPPPGAKEMSEAVQNIRREIKKVQDYQDFLDSLARPAERSGAAGSAAEGAVAKRLKKFREDIKNEDADDKAAIEKIRGLLEHVLSASMIKDLTKEVEAQIAKTIDIEVEKQVAESLKEHTSEALQAELEDYRKRIETAQKDLFNSESRRANSLRRRDGDTKLEPLYKPNGDRASPNFPKDLGSLFALDDETVRSLLEDYGRDSVAGPDARDINLNRFMRFIGVAYQMVRIRRP
ncbi:hypothetical protein NEOLEDRAFT_1137861 [Neolentinus lepideus HHB14362 ss-1]|uniref:Uncharacterized protein n=1 Tax=Neolentinus lepideus HHB14362 ss-1 TaxID=1314782 RepID=A0A165QM18_9AGAM|nr:hypothetical protein NEOLEDRAFT_1137861 [Neolentinus lepideus HHB14362 ss-1]